MDLINFLVLAIALGLLISPLLLLGRNRKKREKKMFELIASIAQKHNCTIVHHDFCGDFVIGFDNIKSFVFFYKKDEDKELEQYVNLADFQKCTIINVGKSVVNNNGNYKVIDLLALNFVPHLKTKHEVRFEFYNTEKNSQISGELQLLEKWSKMINDHLKNMK
jgi:hypothetical protein